MLRFAYSIADHLFILVIERVEVLKLVRNGYENRLVVVVSALEGFVVLVLHGAACNV
jgi:hypothetical protein